MTVSTPHPPARSGGVAAWAGAWVGAVLAAVLGALAGLVILVLVILPLYLWPDLAIPPSVESFLGDGGFGGAVYGAVAGFLAGMGLGGDRLLRRRGHGGAGVTAWLTVALTTLGVAGLYLWDSYLRPVAAGPLLWPYLVAPLVAPVVARGLWLLLARGPGRPGQRHATDGRVAQPRR